MPSDHIVIDVHHDSTSESWLVIYKDGRILHHHENDGWRAANRGLEEKQTWLTEDDLRKLESKHSKPFAKWVAEALRRMNLQ